MISRPLYKQVQVHIQMGVLVMGSGRVTYLSCSDDVNEMNPEVKAVPDMGTDVDYSGTNIQELGVDEPDIVKTDGTYLYVISNSKLYIIYAFPATGMLRLYQR